jgi:hypothetical protein
MSVEALLLLALFVGLPLIEQMIKRARRQRAVLATEAAPKRGDVQRTALERPPDAVLPPPVPRPAARLAPSPQRSRTTFRTRRDRLRRVGEVREAMVMRIILGPCRALDARGDEPPA